MQVRPVSAGFLVKKYIHKDVFVGVYGAITRMDKAVKVAWT